MNPDSNRAQSPDYGVDAPGVVRNLFLVAAAGLACWLLKVIGCWSGLLIIPVFGIKFLLPLWITGLALGGTCGFLGAWMIYESKLGKRQRRERLLDHLAWTGNERVLDVGCGRGLMLVGAAKRLSTGSATGIDVWPFPRWAPFKRKLTGRAGTPAHSAPPDGGRCRNQSR